LAVDGWAIMFGTVQQGWDWAGPQPAQAPPHCTKRNSPPINGQCTNHRTMVLCSAVLMCRLQGKHSRLTNNKQYTA